MGSLLNNRNLSLSDIWIITDLDDTLLGPDHLVSQENRQAIEEFLSLGGHFSVATGRGIHSVENLSIPMNAPAILYNGSAIYDFQQKRVLWNCPLSEHAKDLIFTLSTLFPGLGIEIVTFEGCYVIRQNKETDFHINIMEKLIPLSWSGDFQDIPGCWQKLLLEWDTLNLNMVKNYIQPINLRYAPDFQLSFSYPIMLEVTDCKAHKGTALSELIRLSGFSMGHVIAVGDNINDVEIIQRADIGVAVGNAKEVLKNVADYICTDNTHHIMTELLRTLKQETKVSPE